MEAKEITEVFGQQALFEGGIEDIRPQLQKKFIIPPFSIFDTKQGYWQERKRAWLSLGIQSELGRGSDITWGISPAGIDTHGSGKAYTKKGENKLKNKAYTSQEWVNEKGIKGNCAKQTGTSIFDPVLCECLYRWFCPEKGKILDPFAGGSVRGIVANYLGFNYTGIDLRDEQIVANIEQGHKIMPDNIPNWICGDSYEVEGLVHKTAIGTLHLSMEYDLLFSCPPYYDLEVYSNKQGELSAYKDYAMFIDRYRQIISKCVGLLNENRFACFVIGDIRDKRGFYRNFVSDTIAAFQDAGAILYNEAILITAIGSLPIRITKQFNSGRKLGKTHQNVLVFYKGNPKKIKDIYKAEA